MPRKAKPKSDRKSAPAPRERHTGKQESFLAAYRLCGNVRMACEVAGCNRSTHGHEWRADPEYMVKFEEAKQEAADRLEQEARRRAVEGLQRLKFHEGQAITIPCRKTDPGALETAPGSGQYRRLYVEHEYSDTLLIFLLKGVRPEVYRENVQHGGKVELQMAPLFPSKAHADGI